MNTSKLFVGNLPFSTTEDELRELFSQHGTITSLQLMTDKFTGRSKGFAFVEMSSMEEAEAAIGALHDYKLNGRPMIVNEARPREERPRRDFGNRGPRRDFGGNGGGYGGNRGYSNGGGYESNDAQY